MENKEIVFATYKGEELIGYRADTFGTLSLTHPKIYNYSKEQVDIILKNVKSELNHSGSNFLKSLMSRYTTVAMTTTGQELSMEGVAGRVLTQEEELRELGEFEVRVIPFPMTREEWYGLGEGDEWKRKSALENLSPAVEVHKFKTLTNNEN